VSGVIHLASVLTFSDKYEEVVPPTVKGATNALKSAEKESSTIKSFVYTSSSTAALLPQPGKEIKVTADTWNDDAIEASQKPGVDGFTVYAASKTEGERAVWQVVEETKPSFQVAAVLPNANMGRILQPGAEMNSSTGSWPVQLFTGHLDGFSVKSVPPQWFVDVDDTARLHLAALTDPACNGQRIFAFAEPYHYNDILDIFRKEYPDKKFPENGKEDGRDLSKVPNKEAEELLRKHFGKGWTSFKDSVLEGVKTLV